MIDSSLTPKSKYFICENANQIQIFSTISKIKAIMNDFSIFLKPFMIMLSLHEIYDALHNV